MTQQPKKVLKTQPEATAALPDPFANHSRPTQGEDDEFLAMVAGRMTPNQRRQTDALGLVKSVYVKCRRDAVMAKLLEDFMTLVMAKVDDRRDDGRTLFVTGESGTGKTRAVRHMLAGNPLLQPYATTHGEVTPMVSVLLDGPCTLKLLGQKILKAAGYPVRQSLEAGELWEMLPGQLHLRRVLLVAVDETQHMLKHTKKDKDRIDVAKAFKGVMNNAAWPVSFVMSGMPETTEMARLDEQIERRQMALFLDDVAMPEERMLVVRIVRKLCEPVGLDCSELVASDMPDRIAHSARFRYGRIAQAVVAGIQTALGTGETLLTGDHFAAAYIRHSHAQGRDEMNPFLVDDWENLPAGSFLLKTSERE